MCVGDGGCQTPEGPDPQHSHQQATLALLQSTHHGGTHPCWSSGGAWGGVKPWDPSKLSSSVSLHNHTSGGDEETKHLLLEYYLLTVSLPVPAHMKVASKDALCFYCTHISATKSGVRRNKTPSYIFRHRVGIRYVLLQS